MTDFRGGVGVLARTFLLGTTAPIITHDRSGSDGGIPTGPEATVIVAAAGAFPTTPEAVHTSRQYPVIGTTTIRGRNATVVQPGMDRIGVLVRIGEFDIAAYGSYSAQPDHPVTVGQLVALIDSLQNIR